MARPKKRSADTTTKEQPNTLLNALRFLGLITKDVGAPNETHVILTHKWAIAFNGILSAGHKIPDDIYACPHNSTLIEALSKCGEHVSITQLDEHRLSIKSGKFKAVVPCINSNVLSMPNIDVGTIEINDQFKIGLEAVNPLVVEDTQPIYLTSIFMNGQSFVTTTSKMIFEYWHGLDLPTGIAIPKSFANAIIKSTKKLTKLGYSSSSITIWFEDESFIKTQLYADEWPDLRGILDRPSNAYPLPPTFFEALAAVAPFSADGLVHFGSGVMQSHASGDVGASYEVPGLPGGPIFSAKQLLLLKPRASTVDFLAPGPHEGTTMLMFYGDKIRGVIGGMSNNAK